MIKSHELRIGNYVQYHPKHVDKGTRIIPLKIESVTIQGAVTLNDGFDNIYLEKEINPVSITPEILRKIGFETKDEKFYLLPKGFVELYRVDKFYSWEHDGHSLVSDIEHVHKLQNLYFALVAEELNINL